MPLAVTRRGQGPDLVLLHGWGLGPRAWEPLAALLAADFTMHIVALPGYGPSPPRPRASLAELADALADMLPAAATLCGWSLGAMVALACAERHPARLRRLVLVGGNARFVADETWPEALPAARLDEFVAALEHDPGALLKQFSLLVHHGDSQARRAIRALSGCLADGLPADPDTLRGGLDLLARIDLREAATKVKVPTLLIHGGADPLMPLAGARHLAALLPAARLEIFPTAAHAPFASDPACFAAALRTFAGLTP